MAQFAVLPLQRLHPLGDVALHPARVPLSTCVFFTHSCSVWFAQPIFAAVDANAAQRDE